jgi:hypothetical protein
MLSAAPDAGRISSPEDLRLKDAIPSISNVDYRQHTPNKPIILPSSSLRPGAG